VAYLRLTYPDRGVTAQVHVSWLDPCKVRRVTVVGSRKMALYNDLADEERLRIYDKGVVASAPDDPRNPPMSYRYGGIWSPYVPMQEPLRVQDEHFVECVLTGQRPRTDAESGLAVVRILEAASQSMRWDRAVPLTAGETGADSTPVLVRSPA
jgi:predicted dehydrogenase